MGLIDLFGFRIIVFTRSQSGINMNAALFLFIAFCRKKTS